MCVYQRFHPYNVEYIPAHVARTAYLQYGLTALTLASASGHLAVVTALIAAGADVNAASEVLSGGDVGLGAKLTSHYSLQVGLTALASASTSGHPEVVAALIAAGADVNAADRVLCEGSVEILPASLCGSHFLLAVRRHGTHAGIRVWTPGGVDCTGSRRGRRECGQ
jgi:hypothetical protein